MAEGKPTKRSKPNTAKMEQIRQLLTRRKIKFVKLAKYKNDPNKTGRGPGIYYSLANGSFYFLGKNVTEALSTAQG